MTIANFIIAGTEKAGTTSVFSYLAQHPEVAVSRRKETDFFRSGSGDRHSYASYFPDSAGKPVVVEASPGYLGEARTVVPRMQALIPEVKLLFILREPVSRFLSSYHFHRARLNLPAEMTFGEYLDACLAYSRGAMPGSGLDDWFLKVLPFGCYAAHLRRYFAAFPKEQIMVSFYDDLRGDPRAFMERLSEFLRIDAGFWGLADLRPANVTFSGRSRWLHRLALRVNDGVEPWLRSRPRLKGAVVDLYKSLNRAREGYDDMSDSQRRALEDYYAPHNRDLQSLLGVTLPPSWVTVGGAAQPAADRRVQQGAAAS